MYVVNQVMLENYPYVNQSIKADTMEQAIELLSAEFKG